MSADDSASPLRPAVGVLAVCWGVWWWRVCCADGTAISRVFNFDALMYWLPLLREAAAQWRHATPPLWNPYQALGTPLLATLQAGMLYPLNALYLWIEPGWAWLLTAMIHHAIAGAGLFAYARALQLSRAAALVGATVYLFSWVILPNLFDQPQFICLAWLPLLFACAELSCVAPSTAASARLALVWALQILGGHPETIAVSALLLGAYVAVRVITDLARAPRRACQVAIAASASAALALGLTAAQWLPTYELLQQSVRAPGTLSAAQQAVQAADLWQLLSHAPGRAPLAVALIGVWTWRRRSLAWFFAAAAAVVAVLAAGPATPLFELVRHLPTGTWFRAPTRLLNVWPLCVAVLAAAGTEALAVPYGRGIREPRIRLMVLAAGLVLACRVVFTQRGDLMQAIRAGALFDVLPLAAISLGAVVAGGVRRRSLTLAPYLSPVVVLVLVSALPITLRYDAPDYLTPLHAQQLYGQHAALFARLRSESPARVLSLLRPTSDHAWAKLGTYFEVPVLNDLEPLTLRDFQTFAAALSGPDPAWSFAVFMGNVAPPHPRFDARLLNLSGARFILAPLHEAVPAQWLPPQVGLSAAFSEASATVYENRGAAPRAFFVSNAGARQAGSDCLVRLRDLNFDPLQEVLLDTSPQVTASDATSATVRIAQYAASEARLDVRANQAGVVVLTDAFFPGWMATVDGVAAPVLRADCFFRGVPVAAGTHTVRLRYRPRSFAVGTAVSLFSLGGLAVVVAFSRRRH